MLTEIGELLEEIRRIPASPPVTAREFAELLGRVKSVAGRWADVLEDVHESAQEFAGAREAAALEIAFRKAEESYVELEIAHRDCIERNG